MAIGIRAATARAALTTKIARHEEISRSPPAISMPSTPPPPATPAQAPTAFDRSSGGKELVRIERVEGMTAAAPMAESTRKAITAPVLSTNAVARAATAKIANPPTSTSRRPNRSASAPAGSSRAANTRR